MKMLHGALLTTALLHVCVAAMASGDEPPPLKNNPFARPPSDAFVANVRVADDERDGELMLVATMVSPTARFANVEGRVLRAGDEVGGYKLRRIFEDRAIFERNGREVTIYVKPELEEENVAFSNDNRND